MPTGTPQPVIVEADYRDLLGSLAAGSADLVLTDPPYQISRKTGFKSVVNGVQRFAVEMDYGEWDKTDIDLDALARHSYVALRRGGTIIIFYDVWKISFLYQALLDAGFKQLRLIIWEKTNPVPLNQSVNYLTNSREVAVLGVKGGKPTFNGRYHSGVYRMPIHRDGGKRLHATQKPLRLFTELIEMHSEVGDLVVDPFLGSGTTALAAMNTGRRFIGGDLNPKYTETARERIKGQKSASPGTGVSCQASP